MVRNYLFAMMNLLVNFHMISTVELLIVIKQFYQC